MILERSPPVVLVDLRPERFVLHHDVQNVAKHFERHDFGLRNYRRGSRIKIHARHFAEQITWPQLRDRVSVGEVHGRIDGNCSVASLLSAYIRISCRKRAGELLEKSLRSPLCLYVCNPRRKRNARFAFQKIKCSRPTFALLANNLSWMK